MWEVCKRPDKLFIKMLVDIKEKPLETVMNISSGVIYRVYGFGASLASLATVPLVAACGQQALRWAC